MEQLHQMIPKQSVWHAIRVYQGWYTDVITAVGLSAAPPASRMLVLMQGSVSCLGFTAQGDAKFEQAGIYGI